MLADHARLGAALADRRFRLTTDATIMRSAQTVMVCVPTPVDDQLTPDLTPLREACATVVAQARPRQVIVLTSTSYVGCTHDLVEEPLKRRGFVIGEDIFVAFSPERIDPGGVGHVLENVPRVVGGATAACTEQALAALGGYTSNLHPVSTLETAEMCKLVENAFRAVNIALANEFAEIGREFDLNITEVIDAAATKPFGFMAFRPGPGVGGHCIPVDPHYLLWQLRRRRVSAPMIEQAMHRIAERPRMVAERVRTALGDHGLRLKGSRVLIVGVSYKPDVEDVRGSPALEVIERLRHSGADVAYFDPLIPSVRLTSGATLDRISDLSLAEADITVLHTPHAGLPLDWLVRQPLVLDTTYKLADLPNVLTL
jgi:UDP-N-acetyl-D-glucosamine dehydrogenase